MVRCIVRCAILFCGCIGHQHETPFATSIYSVIWYTLNKDIDFINQESNRRGPEKQCLETSAGKKSHSKGGASYNILIWFWWRQTFSLAWCAEW